MKTDFDSDMYRSTTIENRMPLFAGAVMALHGAYGMNFLAVKEHNDRYLVGAIVLNASKKKYRHILVINSKSFRNLQVMDKACTVSYRDIKNYTSSAKKQQAEPQ